MSEQLILVSQGKWTPASLGSSLRLWLDATKPENFSLAGNSVTTWYDLSPYQDHVSVTNTSPTYDSINKKVIFNGTSNELTSSIVTNNFFNSSLAITAAASGYFDRVTSNYNEFEDFLFQASESTVFPWGKGVYALGGGRTGRTDPSFWRVFKVSDKMAGYLLNPASSRNGLFLVTSAGDIYSNTNPYFNGYPLNYFRRDNSGNDQYTAPSSLTYRVGYGKLDATNKVYFQGSVECVVLVSKILSPIEQAKLEGWWAHTYNRLDLLYPSHPYKNQAPVG
jgi:hypothetical protein